MEKKVEGYIIFKAFDSKSSSTRIWSTNVSTFGLRFKISTCSVYGL